MEIAQHSSRGQEQARQATSLEGEAAAHRSLELHVDGRGAWLRREGALRVVCDAVRCRMLLLWGGRRRPWRARSRQTGDVTNAARPSRSLLWSCLVSTCLVPGVTGQQDLALARSSLMTAVAITAVG